MEQWKRRKWDLAALIVLVVVWSSNGLSTAAAADGHNCQPLIANDEKLSTLDKELVSYVDKIFSLDTISLIPGVDIERVEHSQLNTFAITTAATATPNSSSSSSGSNSSSISNITVGSIPGGPNSTAKDAKDLQQKDSSANDHHDGANEKCVVDRKSNGRSLEDYFHEKWNDFSGRHVVSLNLPQTARFLHGTGKSSFLAGFGMGFLAFALKKLLLPFFIGAQLVKSVLIAMFLPSLLGSLGKIVGKGLSTFSGVSGTSAGLGGAANANNNMEDFEFKDTGAYNNEPAESTFTLNTAGTESTQQAMNRFGFVGNHNKLSDNYYMRQPNRKTDFKVFHKIPSSSMLLTSYDPFYSPLLSRLDAVFHQLGLGNAKMPGTERCREKLVCMMYANPAKYAPYSNLISAQLSRELNELRKPSSDNPEILRFFKYMKAAKDGQDGEACLAHKGCPSLSANQPSPAMLTTFNDINKLVQARQLQ